MQEFSNFLLILISAAITYSFSRKPGVGPIRASSLSTLLFIIFYQYIPIEWPKSAEILFFGGSFIGMSGVDRLSRYTLPLSCIFFYFYFFYIAPQVEGMGGALGLGAFLSVIPIALVNYGLHLLKRGPTQ